MSANITLISAAFFAILLLLAPPIARPSDPIDIGSRRELFVDRLLIDQLDGARLKLHTPVEREQILRFDQPWEGSYSNYSTVLRDGHEIRLYYRGGPEIIDGKPQNEFTCLAVSTDGTHFTRPDFGLYKVKGTRHNNVILANDPACHNFTPFIDTHPNVPDDQRYKAVSGVMGIGLFVFSSSDGIHWNKLSDKPVFTKGSFDSQNVAFFSEQENKYVCYFRNFKNIGDEKYRWISRTTSEDFLHWSEPVEMSFGNAPPEHLYTNCTQPYLRAPHIYLSICARFLPNRMALPRAEYKRLNVHPWQWQGCSDAVFMSTRGDNRYHRTFMKSFIRPGRNDRNWVARANYPATGFIQTGPDELSMYIHRHYAQPSAHLQRLTIRPDGFLSVNTPYAGGQLITRPLIFKGKHLEMNAATSAAGGIRVELQDADGNPIPGYTLDESIEFFGDQLAHVARWKTGHDLSSLADQPVRLRITLKDADLFSIRFIE
jgi:hypothetical protein